jgi:hypothetical protein
VISANTTASALLGLYVATTTTSGFTIATPGALTAGKPSDTYGFSYIVLAAPT